MKDLFDQLEEELWTAASIPTGIRKRVIKWIFPEWLVVINKLREYYWAEKCPYCRTDDIEGVSLDANRYCNRCNKLING